MDLGRALVGARLRQTAGLRHVARARIEPEDLVVLTDAVTAAEEVDGSADRHRGGIVHRDREPADGPHEVPAVDPYDHRRRQVGGREPAREQHGPTGQWRGDRILHRWSGSSGGSSV